MFGGGHRHCRAWIRPLKGYDHQRSGLSIHVAFMGAEIVSHGFDEFTLRESLRDTKIMQAEPSLIGSRSIVCRNDISVTIIEPTGPTASLQKVISLEIGSGIGRRRRYSGRWSPDASLWRSLQSKQKRNDQLQFQSLLRAPER